MDLSSLSISSEPDLPLSEFYYPRGSLEGIIERLKYKPGWKFELENAGLFRPLDWEQGIKAYLMVTCRVPDSFHPETIVTIGQRHPVPPEMDWCDAGRIYHWLFQIIVQMERHEAAEFFQIEGERPFFPHHQEARRG